VGPPWSNLRVGIRSIRLNWLNSAASLTDPICNNTTVAHSHQDGWFLGNRIKSPSTSLNELKNDLYQRGRRGVR
jgi:hypothetical protein